MQGKLVQGISVLLCCLIGWYLYQSIEIVEREQDSRFSKEARNNPFLAAQTLLDKQGVSNQLYQGYWDLFANKAGAVEPSINDSIVLTDSEAMIPEKLATKLVEWVEQGGFLLVSVNGSGGGAGNRANALLDYFGLELYWPDDDELDLESLIEEQSEAEPSTTLMNLDEVEVRVGLQSDYFIQLPEEQEIYFATGPDENWTMVQLELGEGLITFTTDAHIWNNQRIDEFENVNLLQFFFGNSEVIHWFVPRDKTHWLTLLLNFLPQFVLIALLLVGLWLWRMASRFGRIQHMPDHHLSTFSEHIAAAGEFYWRSGQQDKLLAASRNDIYQQLKHKWPGVSDVAKLHLLLSELSDIPLASIEQLFNRNELTQEQFIWTIQGLQKIRKML